MENERITPFKAVPPGEVLASEIKERGCTQKEFAGLIGMTPSHFNELIKGKRPITAEIAAEIECHIDGFPAKFWLNLQKDYEYDKAVISRRTLEEQAAKLRLDSIDEIVSVKDIIKRIGDPDEPFSRKLQTVASVTGDAEPDAALATVEGCFRKSDKVGTDWRMACTWALLAKYAAKSVAVVGKYSVAGLDELRAKLRKAFMDNEGTIDKVKRLLSESGIKFCVVPKLDKASIDGYSFVEADGTPCIAVTARFNMIDRLAFSVMHELGHIALGHVVAGGAGRVSIEGGDSSDEERAADKFATDSLISPVLWRGFVKGKPDAFVWQKECAKWAEANGVNKWIALGRMSHEIGAYNVKSDKTRSIL